MDFAIVKFFLAEYRAWETVPILNTAFTARFLYIAYIDLRKHHIIQAMVLAATV